MEKSWNCVLEFLGEPCNIRPESFLFPRALFTVLVSYIDQVLNILPISLTLCFLNFGLQASVAVGILVFPCVFLLLEELIFMPPKELWEAYCEAYSNRTVRQSVSPSVRPSVGPSRFRVRSISPIFFEVGIPNLVCGYILGWRSVAYHFRVTVTLTLTSDLVFIIIVSGAYLIYYLR